MLPYTGQSKTLTAQMHMKNKEKLLELVNMKKLLTNIIGSVAPTLGTALGGPLGGMAGDAISKVRVITTPCHWKKQLQLLHPNNY